MEVGNPPNLVYVKTGILLNYSHLKISGGTPFSDTFFHSYSDHMTRFQLIRGFCCIILENIICSIR